MIAIRTVVCPVDFSAATARQLEQAGDICRAFGARLVLHHNVTDVAPGAGVGWMWHADHVPPAAAASDAELRALMNRIPPGVITDACVTRGAVTEAVLSVSEAADADLIVLSEHTGKSDDHASVIEFMLENSPRSVLALHDAGADDRAPMFALGNTPVDQSMLVPVNIAHAHHEQVDVAFEIARKTGMLLHLLHVDDRESSARPVESTGLAERLRDLIPKDLANRTWTHVERGDPAPIIVELAKGLEASLIVMGEHTRIPVKRWLHRDNTRAVLHGAQCPVWYVPPASVRTMSFSRFALSDKRSPLWGNV
jgi:nucleotide-binding universal stress UspA family protein